MVRDGTKCDTDKVTENFPREMTYRCFLTLIFTVKSVAKILVNSLT